MNTIAQEKIGFGIRTEGAAIQSIKLRVRAAISNLGRTLTKIDAEFINAREVDEKIRGLRDEHFARFHCRRF